MNASSGPVTPGASIAVGPAATGMGTSSATASEKTKASSSKAAGIPMATAASPLLMVNAAAAAVGVLGMALM